MNGSWFFDRALPIITGIGVTVAASLLGVFLPVLLAQGRDIQKLVDGQDDIKSDISILKTKVDSLDARERQAEADPDKTVARVLGVSAADVSIGTVTFFDGKVVVLPKTAGDVKKLTDGGYALTTISPTVQGYTAPMYAIYPKQ